MKINFKKLHIDAVLPTHAHIGDAGADLTVVRIEHQKGGVRRHYYGIAVEIPMGYVGLLFPRSSICKYNERLSNAVGVIDAGYREEIMAVFDQKFHPEVVGYIRGERSAQLVIVPRVEIEGQWVEELLVSSDRKGGYGTSGK